ncbi:MAG: hypothetical protein AB7G75_14800 [Candidatus Binatia bacterium]
MDLEVGTGKEEQNGQRQEQDGRTESLAFCPICNMKAGRRIRGKLYCGNCGFIES